MRYPNVFYITKIHFFIKEHMKINTEHDNRLYAREPKKKKRIMPYDKI